MTVQLAVSSVILALRPLPEGAASTTPEQRFTLWLPLVRRIREPYEGLWALPGGPLGQDCGLEQAARDTLTHTTGLDPAYLEQLYAFGGVDRSSSSARCDAERVVSIVYWALVRAEEDAAAINGENVAWFPIDELPELAFDHRDHNVAVPCLDGAIYNNHVAVPNPVLHHGGTSYAQHKCCLRVLHQHGREIEALACEVFSR